MLFILRVLSFIAALGFSVAWAAIGNEPRRFDAYAGLAALVFSTSFLTNWIPSLKPVTPHDEKLFNDFRALFAAENLITMYRGMDFICAIRREFIAPLYTVAETWNDAAHSFTHKKLEAKRLVFVAAASDLAGEISGKTVPENELFVTAMPRGADPENLPEWVKQDARDINSKIPAFIAAHEELLSLGNRLGIRVSKH